jgi:prolyl oligopeptidase
MNKLSPYVCSSQLRAGISAAVLALFATSCATPPPSDTPAAAAAASSAAKPSARAATTGAPVRPVTETFFGQSVTDPYRYMENVKDPEVTGFLRAQGERARKTLDAIPGRAALAERISKLAEAGTTVNGVQITASGSQRVFYYKQVPGESMRKLYVREGFGGAERMLFDAQAIGTSSAANAGTPSGATRWALDYYKSSPDGKYALVGVAAGGSEDTSLRLVDVSAGRETGVVIDRIGFTDGSSFAPDGKSFFYNRLPENKAGDAKNRYLRSAAMRHLIGRPADQDEMVFGPGSAGASFADIDIPHVEIASDGRTLIGRVEHGDLREISLYVADAAQLPKPAWRKAVDMNDGVTSYAEAGGNLYLLSNKNAPRNKILRTSLSRPDAASAAAAVPQGDTVIAQMAVAQDALYIRSLIGGVDRLERMNFNSDVYSGGRLEYVRLPWDLAVRQLITDPKRPGAVLRLEGWTEAPRYVTVEPRTGNIGETGLHPKSTVDFSQIEEVRLSVTAKDGVKVPISLMYKRGTTLNGDNPTLMRAYGAYGITQAPFFSPTNMAWLERGGILATCHVRGGGEFGDEWHKAGQKLNKPNTWRDLIACGEYLVQRKFTRSAKLAIQGGSAGGITVGRALTERPDLFAAVVPAVGLLDALRAEFTPNGPPNVPEFGSVKTADGFKGLYEMSSLHHVKDGTQYPGVLLVHGVNDPRVDVWHSAKMAARLQAANATAQYQSKPVLLRLDYDAGHGVGSTRNQRNAELADVLSFVLWQFKDPAFQPQQ